MTRIFTKEENQDWSNKLPGKMCSACMALTSSGKVLMVKAGYKEHWTFPSGIVDPNESPKSAAMRETHEEVGLNVDEERCDLLTVIYAAAINGDRDRFNFAFICNEFDEKAELTVPNEEIEKAEWVSFDEVAEKSGNRESYVNIQKLLLNPSVPRPYIEATPAS